MEENKKVACKDCIHAQGNKYKADLLIQDNLFNNIKLSYFRGEMSLNDLDSDILKGVSQSIMCHCPKCKTYTYNPVTGENVASLSTKDGVDCNQYNYEGNCLEFELGTEDILVKGVNEIKKAWENEKADYIKKIKIIEKAHLTEAEKQFESFKYFMWGIVGSTVIAIIIFAILIYVRTH